MDLRRDCAKDVRMGTTLCGAQCGERAKLKSSKWQLASVEGQTMVAPVAEALVNANDIEIIIKESLQSSQTLPSFVAPLPRCCPD